MTESASEYRLSMNATIKPVLILLSSCHLPVRKPSKQVHCILTCGLLQDECLFFYP